MPTTRSVWQQQVKGVMRLTRYQDHGLFVIITTLLGAQFAGTIIDWRLVLVLVANWLAVGFAFMVNDIEDAPDDALNPAKVQRNPVSAGYLSVPVAYGASCIVAICAGTLFFFLGSLPFRLGLACLALGLLYSWRMVRLKSIPIVDLISHGLLLAGLQFFGAYCTFAPHGGGVWCAPFVFVVSISLYGQLFNEVRDLEGDLQAGVTHTVALVGERVAHVMMYALLAVAVMAFGYATLSGYVPLWVLAVICASGVGVLAKPSLHMRRGSAQDLIGPLHIPLLIVGALTMAVWVIGTLCGL